MIPARTLLAVADLRLGRMGMVTLTARSEDGGKTWKHAGTETPFRANSITALAIASPLETVQPVLFASAVHDNFGYSNSRLPGGLFRSADGGLTWNRLPLGQRWDRWKSCSGVQVAAGRPEVLAAALAPKAGRGDRRPQGVPGVLLSRDGGATWKLLDSGLSAGATTSIRILHLTKDGSVFATSEAGELAVWRTLTFRERFRASYGVSL